MELPSPHTYRQKDKEEELAAMYYDLNPVSLLKQINENLEHLWNLAEHPTHQHRKPKTHEASIT